MGGWSVRGMGGWSPLEGGRDGVGGFAAARFERFRLRATSNNRFALFTAARAERARSRLQ